MLNRYFTILAVVIVVLVFFVPLRLNIENHHYFITVIVLVY